MSFANKGHGGQWEPAAAPGALETGAFESDAEIEGASRAVWMERLNALQAENVRLQGLICYLLLTNEELRRKNGGLG